MVTKKLRELILPFLLFVGFAALYIHNLSRSVYGGDVGDFVTTAAIGGVAHPPGYPFFTLLGWIFIHGLPTFPAAFSMGLISSLSASIGIVFFYLIVKLLTKSKLSAFIASLTLGFSYLFWFYAEIAEVFALYSCCLLALWYLAFLFNETKKTKIFLLFSFLLGFTALIHQTLVLFIPSFLLIIFPGVWKMKEKKMFLPLGILLALSNILWYIYVFVASSHHPIINWDNVHNLSSLLHMILRKDYGTFGAGAFATPVLAQRLIILRTYLFTLLTQITIPVIVLSVVGFIGYFRISWRISIALLLAFFISGPVFITYAGFPLEGSFYFGIYERFFIMSTLPILMSFGIGLSFIATQFTKIFARPLYFLLIHCIFLLIPIQLFFFNMQKTDLSHVYIGDQLGKDFLSPLPLGSLLVIGGDTTLFNTWYVHYVLHVRPDVRLVNLSSAVFDPYILSQEAPLKKQFPKIKGNELVAKTLLEIAKSRHVYFYEQTQTSGSTRMTWIPRGLLYELSPDGKIPEKEEFLKIVEQNLSHINTNFNQNKNYKNFTISDLPQVYAKAIWAVGNYLFYTYKDPDTALIYYKKSLVINPQFDNAYLTIGLVYLTSKNDCKKAEENLLRSIDITPFNELPYFLLYTTYTECYHDKAKASATVKAFEKEFQTKFYDELSKKLNLLKK